ncbi:MAG: hypothetical protein O7G30_16690 [Proteobacteria bacterium]|nr:hypothetical protein [Pseudomonadota bacterium]
MLIFAALGMGAFFLVGLAVSFRLVLLWRRSGEWPELLVAGGLLFSGPIGFTASAGAFELLHSNPTASAWLLGTGSAALSIGAVSAAAFTRLVFRPESGAARRFLWFLALALLAAWVTGGLESGFYVADGLGAWGYASQVLRIGAMAWGTWETLRYWRLMRRRRALGLAEPVVANRFLLWGIGSGGGAAAALVGLASTIANAGKLGVDGPTLIAISAIGMVAAAALFLAFLPPQGYRRFVERRAEARA